MRLLSLLFMFVWALLVGCANKTVEEESVAPIFAKLDKDLSEAYGRTLSKAESQWRSGQPVPLSMVTGIVLTEGERASEANLALAKSVDVITSNDELVKDWTKLELKNWFTSVDQLSFEIGDDDYAYVPAIFGRFYDKEDALNSILDAANRYGYHGGGAEIGFHVDSTLWENRIIELSGYKTVKEVDKPRSSEFFKYSYAMHSEMTSIEKRVTLAKMMLYAMFSDLREFASIDRSEFMKRGNKDYIIERAGGETFAYRYEDRLEAVNRWRAGKEHETSAEFLVHDYIGTKSVAYSDNGSTIFSIVEEGFTRRLIKSDLENAKQGATLWESNVWDEKLENFILFEDKKRGVLLTDKFVRVLDLVDVKEIKRWPLSTKPIVVSDTKLNRLYWANGSNISYIDIEQLSLQSVTKSPEAKITQLLLVGEQSSLYALADNYILYRFYPKKNQLSRVLTLPDTKQIALCGNSNVFLAMTDSNINVHNLTTKDKRQLLVKEGLKSFLCDEELGNVITQEVSGAVTIYSLVDGKQKAVIDVKYGAYEREKSFYQLLLLPQNKFFYTADSGSYIRSTFTLQDIQKQYSARLASVKKSSSWLDHTNSRQVIYAEGLSQRNASLFRSLFGDVSVLPLISEERTDPMLLALRPSVFKSLDYKFTLLQDESGLELVREEKSNKAMLTVSQPDAAAVGFEVSSVSLGYHGFAPKIFNEQKISGLGDALVSVAYSNDAEQAVYGLKSGLVKLSSFPFENVSVLKVSNVEITALAFSPNGRLLAAADSSGRISIWNINEAQKDESDRLTYHAEMKTYAGRVSVLNFIDDERIVSSGIDQTLRIWSLESYDLTGHELLGHKSGVDWVAYDTSLKELISGSSAEGTVRLWDLKSREQSRSFKPLAGAGRSAFHAKQDLTALAANNALTVINLKNTEEIFTTSITGMPELVEFDHLAQVLYLVYLDRVEAFEVETGRLLGTVPVQFEAPIRALKSVAANSSVYVYDKENVASLNMGKFTVLAWREQN